MNDFEDKTILIAAFTAYVAYLNILILVEYYKDQILEAKVESNFERKTKCDQLMKDINNLEDSRDIIRMRLHAFQRLCFILRGTGTIPLPLVLDTQGEETQDSEETELGSEGMDLSNYLIERVNSESDHFSPIHASVSSEESLMDFTSSSTTDIWFLYETGGGYPLLSKKRLYVHIYAFQKCVGAIDGTHMHVKVGGDDARIYRSRKQFPTQNVLVAYTFDLKFTYVLAGWEGSTHDSRILEDALNRVDRLMIPRGKYYLADAGYMLTSSFITPYRGTRYHLKEYTNHAPQNSRELFNLRHSSLRNAVERCIGVLKKRFPIIASGTEPHYDEETMADLVIACCIIHNFLMGVDPDEELISEEDNELMRSEVENETPSTTSRNDEHRRGERIRDSIAMMMWRDYISASH
ncbi:uncharacterized protein LOC144553254 [Carex rostrata]